jgi:hypothetical protein
MTRAFPVMCDIQIWLILNHESVVFAFGSIQDYWNVKSNILFHTFLSLEDMFKVLIIRLYKSNQNCRDS